MMLDYSKESQEEQRLMVELNSLDECLYNKNYGNKHYQQNDDSLEKFNSFAKYQQIKPNHYFHNNQTKNLQSYSQIDYQDEEYDTLFNQGSNFLASMQHIKLPQQPNQTEKSYNNRQNILKSNLNRNGHVQNYNHNCDKNNKYQQILKQQQYVFNKQRRQSINNLSMKKIHQNNKKDLVKNPTQNVKNITKNDKDTYNYMQNTKKSSNNMLQFVDNSFDCLTKNNKIDNKEHIKEKPLKKTVNCKTQQSFCPKYATIQQYLEQIQLQNKQKSQSKLTKNKGQDKNSFLYANNNSLECTFHPKILKKSQQMIKNDKNVVERLSINYQKKNKKMPYQPNINQKNMNLQRLQQLSKPRTIKMPHPQQIQQIPSFRPNLSKKSIKHMSNCTYDVATRNKIWLQQKQQKIAKMKKQEQQQRQRKQQLSHHPSIKAYKGESQVYFSQFGKDGLVQYFERLSLKNKNLSSSNINKDCLIKKQLNVSISNKENTVNNGNKQKKKQTYQQAVKNLHQKIMKLKI